MEVQKDFKELLELFNRHHVEYLIVGAYALAFHGVPRYTGDMDILVKPEKTNADNILAALKDFGFSKLELSKEDFSVEGNVVQLGTPPVRIDLITSITGVSWEKAAANRIKGTYGNVPVFYIAKNEFITNKKALSRHKDLADIEALGEKTE